MRGTWLRYLGLLGFMGLLGLFTSNPGFYGFFGFFGFFGFSGSVNDERLDRNVNRSARNGFVVAILVYVATAVIATFVAFPTAMVYTFGFALSFGLQMFTFGLSLVYYEHKGDIG